MNTASTSKNPVLTAINEISSGHYVELLKNSTNPVAAISRVLTHKELEISVDEIAEELYELKQAGAITNEDLFLMNKVA